MPRLTAVFAATTVMASIVAGYLWHQLRSEREHVGRLEQRIAQSEQRQALSAFSGVSEPQPAGAPAEAAPAPAPLPVQTGSSAPAIAAAPSRDPALCAAQKGQIRARMSQAYPDVANVLSLSQAQTAALFDVLARQQENALATICGSDEEREQARRAAATLQQTQQMDIQALLGAVKYQQWEEYLPTRDGRMRVNELRAVFAASDTPLTDAQAEPLLTTVLAEGQRRRDETSARPPRGSDARSRLQFDEETVNLLEESYGRVVSSAASYLHADQLAVMKGTMLQLVASQRAQLNARRAQIEAGDNVAAQPQR